MKSAHELPIIHRGRVLMGRAAALESSELDSPEFDSIRCDIELDFNIMDLIRCDIHKLPIRFRQIVRRTIRCDS